MRPANGKHEEFLTLMVPDRDDPAKDKERPFLFSYPQYIEGSNSFSGATRGMFAFDITYRRENGVLEGLLKARGWRLREKRRDLWVVRGEKYSQYCAIWNGQRC